MNNKKIVQIIPAPEGLWASHEGIDGVECRFPIIAFALIEIKHKYRYAAPLEIDNNGDIDIATDEDDFIKVSWQKADDKQ